MRIVATIVAILLVVVLVDAFALNGRTIAVVWATARDFGSAFVDAVERFISSNLRRG